MLSHPHTMLIHEHSAANLIGRPQNNVLLTFFTVITYAMQAQVIHNVVVAKKKGLRSNNDSWRSSQYSAAQSVAEKGVKKALAPKSKATAGADWKL
jgi:hypothetical protein